MSDTPPTSDLPTSPPSEDSGFVLRGFLMLAGMTILVGVVLALLFWQPQSPPAVNPAELPADASAPGWKVRYNAAIALARRGSDKTPWPILREMLDENQQFRNFVEPAADPKKKPAPDEAAARATVREALKAVAEWHRKNKDAVTITPDMRSVYAQVDRLAENPAYKDAVDETRKTLPSR